MYEYEVKLTRGTAWVYADRYEEIDGEYRFSIGESVVMQFPSNQVLNVKRTWPEKTP